MIDRGTFKIKCVRVGGLALDGYGGFVFEENEEVDLLGDVLPDTLKCIDYSTADRICSDANLERAANGATFAAFFNSGQVCMSVDREGVMWARRAVRVS